LFDENDVEPQPSESQSNAQKKRKSVFENGEEIEYLHLGLNPYIFDSEEEKKDMSKRWQKIGSEEKDDIKRPYFQTRAEVPSFILPQMSPREVHDVLIARYPILMGKIEFILDQYIDGVAFQE